MSRCPSTPEFPVGTKVRVRKQGYVVWWHHPSNVAWVAAVEKVKCGGKMSWSYNLVDEDGNVQFNRCSANAIDIYEEMTTHD